jgi:hypothetical protein
MAEEIKLEPGWLARDVNHAAERAKTLDAARANKKESSQESQGGPSQGGPSQAGPRTDACTASGDK